MTTERIKEIQAETGYPDSVSVQQALLKVWNECEQDIVKTCNKPAVINNEAVICKDCGKYKKTQGNGIMHQLCECASEVAVCPKCHDRGWIYDDTTNTRTVCPCHY